LTHPSQELLAAVKLAEPIIVLNTATVHQTVAYNKTGSSGSEFLCALDALLFTVTNKPSHVYYTGGVSVVRDQRADIVSSVLVVATVV